MTPARQKERAQRVAAHHGARAAAAAGQPARDRDVAWDEIRAAINRLPPEEAAQENTRLAGDLRRRAADIRMRR